MIERRLLLMHILGYVALIFFVCATQSSFFSQIFDAESAPNLYLAIVVYIGLHRSFVESVLWIYTVSFLISSFSNVPIGFMLLTQFVVVLGVRAVRDRIFWPGWQYFSGIYAASISVFHLSFYLISIFMEENPAPSPYWLAWLIQILWAPVVGPILHVAMQMMDSLTNRTSVLTELDVV